MVPSPGRDVLYTIIPYLETAPSLDGLPSHLSNPGRDGNRQEFPYLEIESLNDTESRPSSLQWGTLKDAVRFCGYHKL